MVWPLVLAAAFIPLGARDPGQPSAARQGTVVISLVAALVGAILLGVALGGDAVAYTIGQATVPCLLTGLVVGFVWRDVPRLPVWLVPLPTVLVGSLAALFLNLVGNR